MIVVVLKQTLSEPGKGSAYTIRTAIDKANRGEYKIVLDMFVALIGNDLACSQYENVVIEVNITRQLMDWIYLTINAFSFVKI